MLDTKIVGGTIVDGSGRPGFAGDIGIRDGRIVAIGEVGEDAEEVIDATGRIVAPGFVDSHTHYDAQVFWDPTLSPSSYHGVTTVVGGFCGFSIAPLTEESGPYLQRMLSRVEGMPLETLEVACDWDWSSFGEYLDRLEGRIGINAGFFAGHSAIRRAVMAERAVGEEANAGEIAAMKALLGKSLKEGALGLSTTISATHNDYEGQPVPSRWAAREEFLELAGVVAEHEGTGLEMLPNLDFPEGVPELMADFSIAGQRPVNWNVMIVSGRADAAQRMRRQLAITDMARKKGGDVIALTMPSMPGVYMNLKTGVTYDAFPGLSRKIFFVPFEERVGQLGDPAIRQQLADDLASMSEDTAMYVMGDFAGHTVVDRPEAANGQYEGRKVGDIAAELGKSPLDTALDIALEDGLETIFRPDMGGLDRASWELRGEVWADDRTLVGASDAGAHLDLIDSFAFSTAVLEDGVREQGIISLEAGIHQITGRPAAYFGLVDRGELKQGYHADIVVFDADRIARGPTYRRFDLPDGESYRLYADAIGIDHVLVNGVEIVRGGEHTGKLPGTVLRSGRDTRTVAIDALQAKAA